MLKNQIYLSKQLKISISESDNMSYMEFTNILRLGTEYLKETGPKLSDFGD